MRTKLLSLTILFIITTYCLLITAYAIKNTETPKSSQNITIKSEEILISCEQFTKTIKKWDDVGLFAVAKTSNEAELLWVVKKIRPDTGAWEKAKKRLIEFRKKEKESCLPGAKKEYKL